MTEKGAAVSVDVEEWYPLTAVSGAPFSAYSSAAEFIAEWGGRYNYLTAASHRKLELLDEFNVKPTFFVVADAVESYSGLVDNITDPGHVMGCHGRHHEYAVHPHESTC